MGPSLVCTPPPFILGDWDFQPEASALGLPHSPCSSPTRLWPVALGYPYTGHPGMSHRSRAGAHPSRVCGLLCFGKSGEFNKFLVLWSPAVGFPFLQQVLRTCLGPGHGGLQASGDEGSHGVTPPPVGGGCVGRCSWELCVHWLCCPGLSRSQVPRFEPQLCHFPAVEGPRGSKGHWEEPPGAARTKSPSCGLKPQEFMVALEAGSPTPPAAGPDAPGRVLLPLGVPGVLGS